MSGLGYFFLFLIVLIPLAIIAYILYTRITAQRAGRQTPPLSSYIPFRNSNRQNYSSSSSGGILNTVRSKIQSLSGGGSHRTGAYEQPLGTGRGRGLDPDGAWDARVGDEADAYGSGGYYEEQELGLRTGGGYGGHGTELPDYGNEEMGRGRSISRDEPGFIGGSQGGLDQRYDEETRRENPFGDQAERSSMRGVSPRPANVETGYKKQAAASIEGDSPTERRSMFHENM
ncbi:MAG: hypothetical protein L6R42_005378 [Xanthoria sp. 1 TBL-2021]|nr:MAG: hypothetical protein L6R42_005378 [Xanthoria sp. 1 TBL-2021]